MIDSTNFRTAIVHEWFVNYAGSERVVECMVDVFPESELFALVDFLKAHERDYIKYKKVHTSFIQKLPFAESSFRTYLPLFPLAVEQYDLRNFDVILSSSHAVSKGILTSSDQLHISYCHSPVRYAWDLYHQYLEETGLSKGIKGMFAKIFLHRLRNWDYTSANRVNYFIANSKFIARRIKNNYGREAAVIYPPVDVEAFSLEENKQDYYLTASRMVPYKKNELIVEAFSQMPDKKLIVVGNGPEHKKVKAKAGRNIEFLDHLPFTELKKLMQQAKAFVFAAEEDFGITIVEAQACGTPVIAYGKGGAAETVVQDVTGRLFYKQEVPSLVEAVKAFEANQDKFYPAAIRENALKFSKERFKKELNQFVVSKIEQFNLLYD